VTWESQSGFPLGAEKKKNNNFSHPDITMEKVIFTLFLENYD